MRRRHVLVVSDHGRILAVENIPADVEVDVLDYNPDRPGECFECHRTQNGQTCWLSKWYGHPVDEACREQAGRMANKLQFPIESA